MNLGAGGQLTMPDNKTDSPCSCAASRHVEMSVSIMRVRITFESLQGDDEEFYWLASHGGERRASHRARLARSPWFLKIRRQLYGPSSALHQNEAVNY
jgi:hypothetical protein